MKNQFSIKTKKESSIPVIYLYGDVTAESDELITKTFRKLLKKSHTKIILNFEDVKYINSSGMATMLALISEKNQEVDLKFVALSSHFKKIMKLVGITDFVDTYETISEAINN